MQSPLRSKLCPIHSRWFVPKRKFTFLLVLFPGLLGGTWVGGSQDQSSADYPSFLIFAASGFDGGRSIAGSPFVLSTTTSFSPLLLLLLVPAHLQESLFFDDSPLFISPYLAFHEVFTFLEFSFFFTPKASLSGYPGHVLWCNDFSYNYSRSSPRVTPLLWYRHHSPTYWSTSNASVNSYLGFWCIAPALPIRLCDNWLWVNASSVLCELVICEMSKRQNALTLSFARTVYLSTSNFNLKPLWSLRWILKGQNVKLGNVRHFWKVLHTKKGAHHSSKGATRFMQCKSNCLRN